MQLRKNVEGRGGEEIARETAEGITLLYVMLTKPKETDFFSCSKMTMEGALSFTQFCLIKKLQPQDWLKPISYY